MENILGGNRKDTIREIASFYESNEFKNMQPVKGAPENIKEIAETNKLYVVTSRTETTDSITRYQLDKYFPDCFEKICYTNGVSDKHVCTSKAKIFKKIGTGIIIEDCLDHVKRTNRKVIIRDRPWNREKLSKNMYRAKTWNEIKCIVKKIA